MAKRIRRSHEQMIKDLQDEILRIKERAERAKVKKDPALKHVAAALRSLDKAAAATEDKDLARSLKDARATLASSMKAAGAPASATTLTPRRSVEVAPEAIVAYLSENPGSSGEEVSKALGCDTKSLRPTMKKLIAAKRVKSKGKARGMRYSATKA